MMKKIGLFIMIFAFVLLMINTGCKDFGVPDYNFTVTLGDGVSGLPAAGSYSYKELSTINYEYIFTDNTERSPGVFINNSYSSYPSAGTITMYRDMEIFVGDVIIEGSWNLVITDKDETKTETTFLFTSGVTKLEGTFTDGRGYTGTWKNVDNKVFISFTNWDGRVFEGEVSPKYLSGTMFFGETGLGTWTMTRE